MHNYPHCWRVKIEKNGQSWHSKQNYNCRHCKRKTLERQITPSLERELLLRRRLLERLSLRAIARVLQVSLVWLVVRVKQLWQQVPQQLLIGKLKQAEVALYCLEADEMFSYVSAKDCPQWLWLAIERHTGLVAGFPIGARDEESALGLWLSISEALRTHALVFTDNWPVYAAVLQKGQHQTEGKKQTTRMERLNNTLCQRCSRLVRKTLSFSKSWQNHFLAICLFLVNYNFEILAKKPSSN